MMPLCPHTSCPQIWRELFSPLHALNFGIGGDSTQHVLWRLENGELEHIRPKVSTAWVGSQSPLSLPPTPLLHPLFPQIVVVWVGTNNHGHTAEQVTGGIKAIVQLVNERQPQARVVVLVREGRAGGGRRAVVWDPFGCSHSCRALGSSAQSSGFQAKSHVEAFCAHQKCCGEGRIRGQIAPFVQGTAGHSEGHSVVSDSLRPHGLYRDYTFTRPEYWSG